jgi:hypothetical protein
MLASGKLDCSHVKKSSTLLSSATTAMVYLIFALSTTNIVSEVKITTQNTSYKEYRLKNKHGNYV